MTVATAVVARRLLAGILVLVGATSCTTTTGGGGTAGAIPTPRTTADLALPLDAYDLPAADREVVDKARFLMLADCTRKFGVELKTHPIPARPRHKNADYLDWQADLQVEKYGYAGPPEQLMESAGYTGYSVSDEQMVVLRGRRRTFHGKALPPGGCTGRTEALLDQGSLELLGGKAAQLGEEQALFMLADDAAQDAYTDRRIRDAERVWSDCMLDAGFDYPDPVAAAGDPRWGDNAATDQFPKPRGTRAEIATAGADEECRMDTNYYGVRQAAYRDSQHRIILKNQARLDRIKIINQAQIKNARKFLAGELAVAW
ncbi:hypothetical protein [Planotetraspora mira]|uniref:Lipoprotein n=1 Tax=Planotetraspora mira TaxID=58121 RepID=A0A8J3XA83_9ACTN|nr:hypothetical protein [Planotetraspora mira]GII33787.1 hypothetical protein Pmi06nite_72290 [Planotetraspora mira]